MFISMHEIEMRTNQIALPDIASEFSTNVDVIDQPLDANVLSLMGLVISG